MLANDLAGWACQSGVLRPAPRPALDTPIFMYCGRRMLRVFRYEMATSPEDSRYRDSLSPPCSTLVVNNVSPDVSAEAITAIFAKVGTSWELRFSLTCLYPFWLFNSWRELKARVYMCGRASRAFAVAAILPLSRRNTNYRVHTWGVLFLFFHQVVSVVDLCGSATKCWKQCMQ